MEEVERARVSSEVFDSLARIVHRTALDASAILQRDGLNTAQWQLLRALRKTPGVTQKRLVEHRGGTPGGVSMLVTKVEELGLVRREAQGAANRLWLTDAGEQLVDRLVPQQELFFARRFGSLDDNELQAWQRLADRALEGLPSDP